MMYNTFDSQSRFFSGKQELKGAIVLKQIEVCVCVCVSMYVYVCLCMFVSVYACVYVRCVCVGIYIQNVSVPLFVDPLYVCRLLLCLWVCGVCDILCDVGV